MFYTTKVNKNPALIELCENHAKSLGLIGLRGNPAGNDWFWMYPERGDYGAANTNPSDWYRSDCTILDLADFLMVKPQQQEIVLGCSKIYLKKDSLTDGQHSIPRDSTKLKNLLSVFREGILSCYIFGHKVHAKKGNLWVDNIMIPADKANLVAEWIEGKSDVPDSIN